MSSEVTGPDIVLELIEEAADRCGAELSKCNTDDAKLRWLRRSIAKYDIVIGYWPDSESTIGYHIIKGRDAVFSLGFVAQAAGDGWRANHGFKTAVVPCLDLEDAKVVELEYGDAAVEKAKLAKLFDMLPPEESDALKVKYGLVGLQ